MADFSDISHMSFKYGFINIPNEINMNVICLTLVSTFNFLLCIPVCVTQVWWYKIIFFRLHGCSYNNLFCEVYNISKK